MRKFTPALVLIGVSILGMLLCYLIGNAARESSGALSHSETAKYGAVWGMLGFAFLGSATSFGVLKFLASIPRKPRTVRH